MSVTRADRNPKLFPIKEIRGLQKQRQFFRGFDTIVKLWHFIFNMKRLQAKQNSRVRVFTKVKYFSVIKNQLPGQEKDASVFLSDSVTKIVHVNEMFRLITLSQVIRDWQTHVRLVLHHRTQSEHIREKRLDESKAHSLFCQPAHKFREKQNY